MSNMTYYFLVGLGSVRPIVITEGCGQMLLFQNLYDAAIKAQEVKATEGYKTVLVCNTLELGINSPETKHYYQLEN